MQVKAINPNINIGFRQKQNQNDINQQNNKLYIKNNIVSKISLPIELSTSAISADLLLHGISGVKKRFKDDKLFYLFVGIMSLAPSIKKEYLVPEFFGKKVDKKTRNFLIAKQAISTVLLGPLLICGISQAINNKDRKSGIIAACLSGVALAATTISNIATWKNYKKDKNNVVIEK